MPPFNPESVPWSGRRGDASRGDTFLSILLETGWEQRSVWGDGDASPWPMPPPPPCPRFTLGLFRRQQPPPQWFCSDQLGGVCQFGPGRDVPPPPSPPPWARCKDPWPRRSGADSRRCVCACVSGGGGGFPFKTTVAAEAKQVFQSVGEMSCGWDGRWINGFCGAPGSGRLDVRTGS